MVSFFKYFFQLSTSAQKYVGIVRPYNLERCWNMLGGDWISKGFFISQLERKGGPKEKKFGAHTGSQKNHLQIIFLDDFLKV